MSLWVINVAIHLWEPLAALGGYLCCHVHGMSNLSMKALDITLSNCRGIRPDCPNIPKDSEHNSLPIVVSPEVPNVRGPDARKLPFLHQRP